MKIENIISIGELNAADGGKNLTPVFKGDIHPILVHVTKDEFNAVRGDKQLMKQLAISKLN